MSSRYGKSNLLAICVTILAVIGVTPYIALQLQSITLSFSIFFAADPTRGFSPGSSVFWVASGLAVFAILFGTRNLDVNERHYGVVTAKHMLWHLVMFLLEDLIKDKDLRLLEKYQMVLL